MSTTSPNPAGPFTRPAFPSLQPSSAASSTYQSYSSMSTLSSSSPASAPLPSPSSTRPQHQQGFFGSLNQQQQSQQTQQQSQQQRQMSFEYKPNREGAGRTAAETATYLNEYALLAEAAKRAQMAVLMRDVESMEL